MGGSAAQLKAKGQAWAANLKNAADNLQKMAEDQQSETPHSEELLAFINDAVQWEEIMGCGGPPSYSNTAGCYLKLFLDANDAFDFEPTIADVHTQPIDAGGSDVGRGPHVGTGYPRLMVVTVDACQGPRAYADLAFSYGERITDDWQRLNDNEWEDIVTGGRVRRCELDAERARGVAAELAPRLTELRITALRRHCRKDPRTALDSPHRSATPYPSRM